MPQSMHRAPWSRIFASGSAVDFLPVADPLVNRTGLRLRALDLDETGGSYPLATAPTSSLNAGSRDSARARASASRTRL